MIKSRVVFFSMAMLLSSTGYAQCAPGVPSAGNPGCIPPDQDNSPYSQSAAPPQAPAAKWADRWGSVAVDEKTGKFGTVSQSASKARAESQALDRCANAGGSSCQIYMTYNNQCVAVAQVPSGGRIHATRGPYLGDTEKSALNDCGSDGKGECQITYSKCSYAERIQ
jgi:hypothetical protein